MIIKASVIMTLNYQGIGDLLNTELIFVSCPHSLAFTYERDLNEMTDAFVISIISMGKKWTKL